MLYTYMRKSWDEYFLDIATAVATRSTCDRRYVGCVLVRDKTILSTGYNGSIRGLPHCDEVGHLMENGHCIRTVHAEANAVAQAARNGVMVAGATCYVTANPCWNCFKLLANAGTIRICYKSLYKGYDSRIWSEFEQTGIELLHFPEH